MIVMVVVFLEEPSSRLTGLTPRGGKGGVCWWDLGAGLRATLALVSCLDRRVRSCTGCKFGVQVCMLATRASFHKYKVCMRYKRTPELVGGLIS